MAKRKSKIFKSTKEVNEAVWNFIERIANDESIDFSNVVFVCVDHGGKPFYNLVLDNLIGRTINRS